MKYLKSFNESIENQIYQQVLDSIKDCFQEFEDNGWHWIIDPSSVYGAKMNLRKLESDIDEALLSILPELDYEEVVFDMSRFDRVYDDDTDINDYSFKILLNF